MPESAKPELSAEERNDRRTLLNQRIRETRSRKYDFEMQLEAANISLDQFTKKTFPTMKLKDGELTSESFQKQLSLKAAEVMANLQVVNNELAVLEARLKELGE